MCTYIYAPLLFSRAINSMHAVWLTCSARGTVLYVVLLVGSSMKMLGWNVRASRANIVNGVGTCMHHAMYNMPCYLNRLVCLQQAHCHAIIEQ